MLCRVLVVCLCFNTLSGTVYASETDNSSQLEYSNTSNVKVWNLYQWYILYKGAI